MTSGFEDMLTMCHRTSTLHNLAWMKQSISYCNVSHACCTNKASIDAVFAYVIPLYDYASLTHRISNHEERVGDDVMVLTKKNHTSIIKKVIYSIHICSDQYYRIIPHLHRTSTLHDLAWMKQCIG